MSDLLNSASLVMIPSGYKEDVVYSQIPTDGSGDLSFTRASNGTRVNSAGLVEVVPWNLMPYSETFNLATGGWNLQNGATTVANSGTAPNGTNTATLLYASVTNVIVAPNRRAEPTTAPSTAIYTQYVYAKASGKNWFALYNFDGSSGTAAWFNLSTGVLGTVASGCTAFIESAGNGWYKCGFTQSVTANGNLYMHIYPTDSDNTITVTASGTNGILIWGAQINIGSTAKPYFPTTDRLNVPRLTYQNGGGGCPSLLLEKQSTNIITYSEQFDNAAWNKISATITANAIISPDGTQNADLLNVSSTGLNLYNAFGATANQTHTASIFVKSGTMTTLIFGLSDNLVDEGSASYNLTTLTASVVGSTSWTNQSASIVDYGNGWYRLIYTGTNTSGSVSFVEFIRGSVGTLYVWGAQNEISSYPTSYIPTTSSSATRVVDACYKNSYAGGISNEATIFADFEYQRNDGGYSTPCLIYNASLGNYVYLFVLSNTIRAICVNAGGVQSQIISSAVTPNTRYKVAAGFKTNDFVVYVNGSLIGTDTSGTMPTFSNTGTTITVGTDTSFTEPVGKLNEFVLFPTRLTNAELASLTTL